MLGRAALEVLRAASTPRLRNLRSLRYGRHGFVTASVKGLAGKLAHHRLRGRYGLQGRSPVQGNNRAAQPNAERPNSEGEAIFTVRRYAPLPRIISEAFCPIIMLGALVLPPISFGMTEASATRSPSTPRTFSVEGSTTAISSVPILQVPTG